MRMTKTSTNTPMTPSAWASPTGRNDGTHPCHSASWPSAIPARLHAVVTRHTRAPLREMFSRAMNTKHPASTGPHPVR